MKDNQSRLVPNVLLDTNQLSVNAQVAEEMHSVMMEWSVKTDHQIALRAFARKNTVLNAKLDMV